jgi:hypothetical protein
MKTILFISIIVMSTLMSCSECDEPRYEADINKLYGVWILQKSTLNGEEIVSQSKVEFTTEAIVKFTYNGEGTNGEDIIDNGLFSIFERTLIINWENNISGNDVTKYYILELTDTKLKWQVVVPHVGNHIEYFTR